ncbi:MAG: hypothetical protein IKP36_09665 [Bacteroidaceae bacterium]|nr:hypothetical protein [Bacteroidaceae bacterium]
MQDITKKTKEERFREMAKDGIVCQSLDCPIRKHCLRSILKDYVPENTPVTTVVNLRNPKMQSADCPRYCPDEPLRMPIGLTHMYYDMPGHLERSIKNRLISIFSRKRYYIYHGGRRPITPDIEETIRQTLLAFGWTAEPVFDGYVEEYLW